MTIQLNHFGQTFLKGDFIHIYEATSTTFQEMISKHDFTAMCTSFNDGFVVHEGDIVEEGNCSENAETL